MLENLEKVMPPRVHLVSISPQLDEDNQLALKMTVAGDSRDRAIELARRMEESRRFAQTQIISRTLFAVAPPAIPSSSKLRRFTFRSRCRPGRRLQRPKQSRRQNRNRRQRTRKPRAERSRARRRRKEASTDARSAANPEESEDRAGHYWRASICWRRSSISRRWSARRKRAGRK